MSQADDENSVALFTERSTGSKESAAPSIASSTTEAIIAARTLRISLPTALQSHVSKARRPLLRHLGWIHGIVKMNLPMKRRLRGGEDRERKGRSASPPPALQPTALEVAGIHATSSPKRKLLRKRVEGDDVNGGMEDGEVVNGDEGEGRSDSNVDEGEEEEGQEEEEEEDEDEER